MRYYWYNIRYIRYIRYTYTHTYIYRYICIYNYIWFLAQYLRPSHRNVRICKNAGSWWSRAILQSLSSRFSISGSHGRLRHGRGWLRPRGSFGLKGVGEVASMCPCANKHGEIMGNSWATFRRDLSQGKRVVLLANNGCEMSNFIWDNSK